MLGTYTNFVNLLDLCAVTIPIAGSDEVGDRPPASLTLIAPAWNDGLLVSLASTIARTPASHRSR
jgi:allophanate hydrolase